jgi:hypothetical protein
MKRKPRPAAASPDPAPTESAEPVAAALPSTTASSSEPVAAAPPATHAAPLSPEAPSELPAGWEFFSRVRRTPVRRPVIRVETDVKGQAGSVRASAATIYGPNWYHDPYQDLIEIWDAGPALCFRDVLPKKEKYAREGLYLRITLAYRTTANAFANIRTFSGNHVTLPNSLDGELFDDPYTRYFVTDDCTININSLYHGERLWIQRVDWEWTSQETIFEDELYAGAPLYLDRRRDAVEALYVEQPITDETVKALLIDRIQKDTGFAKRCLLLLEEGKLLGNDLAALHEMLNHDSAKT